MDRYVRRWKEQEEGGISPKRSRADSAQAADVVGQRSIQKQGLDMRELSRRELRWRKVTSENLDLDYTILLPSSLAFSLLQHLEETVTYLDDDLAKVKVHGKWYPIPRKQVAYGDDGMTYTFSGNCLHALPWPLELKQLRDAIHTLTSHYFNFVLVNRYKDGNDRIGLHKDNEKDLDLAAPIASVSLGQHRDFVLRHQDSYGKKKTRDIAPVKINLEHGSLLMMNNPTNNYWYHELPRRANCPGVRINLTFRKMGAD